MGAECSSCSSCSQDHICRSPDCAHDLEALRTIVDANSLRGDGTLNGDEVKQSLRCLGLYPDESQVAVEMKVLDLSFPVRFSELDSLAKRLNHSTCRRGLNAVPYARRGLYLHQLQRLCKYVVHSGWLKEKCFDYNTTNAAGIRDGNTLLMRENLYALDRFFIHPVTATDADLRRHVPPAILSEMRLSVPCYNCCYSQLVNPDGVIVHIFVSHFWGHPFVKTVDALEKYVSQISQMKGPEARQHEQISFWICAFALNQHCVENELGESPETAPFNAAIAKATIGVVMVMDASAEPLKRIWCLFEVARARELGKPLQFVDDGGLRGAGRPSSLGEKETTQLAEKINAVSAFAASASVADDRLSIWYRIQNPATTMLFPGFTAFRQRASAPANSCAAIDCSDFTDFDMALKRLLATPLLIAAIKAGLGKDALRYIGMGADCDVSVLITLENQGVDLHSSLSFRFMGMIGRTKLLYILALRGKSEELRFLLSRGAAVNNAVEFSPCSGMKKAQKSMMKSTPLHAAVKHGDVESLSVLLEYRADVNAASSDGSTALRFCASRSSNVVEKATLLLGSKAEIQSQMCAESLLNIIANQGNEALISLLLDRKCSVNDHDCAGETPLHTAAFVGNDSLVQFLLERSADIAAKKNDGATPLHTAVSTNQKAVAATILARQADTESRDNDGRTPLQLATSKNNSEMASLIREYEGSS